MQKRGPLQDYVKANLDILFVGINPGRRSASLGHHYAGHSNRFWKLLYQANFVSKPLTFQEDREVLKWNIGLTNMVAKPSRGISDLSSYDFNRGRTSLLSLIRRCRPKIIALVGVTLFPILFPKANPRKGTGQEYSRTPVGLRPQTIGVSRIFVLPNPSGRNAHYTYQEMLEAFCSLKRFLDRQKKDNPVSEEQ